MITITIILLVLSIAIAAFFIVLEWAFIKRRSKGAMILPIIVTCIAVIAIISSSIVTTNKGGIRGAVTEDNVKFRFLRDYDGNTVAIGQVVVGDIDNAKYIDLEFKDGKLVGSEDAMEYKDFLENNLEAYTKGLNGESVTYGELVRLKESGKFKMSEKSFSGAVAVRTLPIYGIVPFVMWLMFAIERSRRSKKRNAAKVKINDL